MANSESPIFCIFKKTKGLLRTTERMKLQNESVSRFCPAAYVNIDDVWLLAQISFKKKEDSLAK
jgi:hypothetical protein